MRSLWLPGLVLLVGLGFLVVVHHTTIEKLPKAVEPIDCRIPQLPLLRSNYEVVRWEGDELTVSDVSLGRDLSKFENLSLRGAFKDSNLQQTLAQARTLLWQRWQARRLTYLRLTLSSVDATTTSHIFIEPDELGRWRLEWRMVRHYGVVQDLPNMYAMRWVSQAREWRGPETPLPRGQQPDPAMDKLEFFGICGARHSL